MTTIRIKYLTMLLMMIMATGAVSAQTADSLSHYLKIAASNNPGVKADFMVYKASLQKIPQAGAYQDPELEMGFFLEPMDIIGGKQVAEFKLMQMFPWFGTKKAAQTEATHMAKCHSKNSVKQGITFIWKYTLSGLSFAAFNRN